MLNILIVIIAVSLSGFLAFSKKLQNSSNWNATVTPLASIMGSGFLISAPLLGGLVGNLAVVFMGILLVLAYFVGGAIRFNIKYFEPIEHQGHGIPQDLATASRVVLIGAYFISITYYLELLAAFVLKMLNFNNPHAANFITTAILLFIGGVGIFKGLDRLESIEKYAVSLNLGMIGALIFSLVVYNVQFLLNGTWTLPDISSIIDFSDLRILLGLLIVVQGFETSRYLGDKYPAEQRVATMRKSQIISSIIYVVFVGLATVLFHDNMGSDVTAIINLAAPVATVLPVLLAIAAIGSQFSASVADNSGAGGLMEDITNKKLPIKYAYLILLLGTLFITWLVNVNQIIAYASRAFALYYALQCLVAFFVAKGNMEVPKRQLKMISFIILAIICVLVFVLGIPSG